MPFISCSRKASAALQQKRKPVALSYLRSRKQLEEQLNKRLGSLSTLESTFLTVEAAAGDIEACTHFVCLDIQVSKNTPRQQIMKSYESSTATLRAILAHPSLERSSIDKTMEALAEANADAKEMDDAVRLGGDLALGVEEIADEAELEEEWKAMLKEMKAESRANGAQDTVGKMLGEAGNVPTDAPAAETPQVQRVPVSSR